MSDNDNHDGGWPAARWARILDRIELRRPDLGLKFWGPPLWLEVTMTGPDSDRWPANPEGNQSWNWLSSETCSEGDRLLEEGADDDHLLVAAARYTVENLILNAVHEIGEWLRFDGRRIFPAHNPVVSPPAADTQGNGSVRVAVTFGAAGSVTPGCPPTPPAVRDSDFSPPMLSDLTQVAAPGRFTYLPATSVHYRPDGPRVGFNPSCEAAGGWQSTWSTGTLSALSDGAAAEAVIDSVQRDVHGALVAWEAERICRAFFIDGRQRWRLRAPQPQPGADRAPAGGDDVDQILSLKVTYPESN